MAQLPPINGKSLYEPIIRLQSNDDDLVDNDENDNDNPSTGNSKKQTSMHSPDYLGHKLWDSILDVVELTENFRAQRDPHFIDFLDRVRMGKVPTEDQLDRLNARRINSDLLSTDPFPLGTPMIWFTNDSVNDANSIMAHRIAHQIKKPIYRFAVDIKPQTDGSERFPFNSYLHQQDYLISNLHKSNENKKSLLVTNLDLYLGVTLAIQRGNELLKYGIANGSQGTFVGTWPPITSLFTSETNIALRDGSKSVVQLVTTPPTHLLLHLPGSTIQFEGLPAGILPVSVQEKKHIKIRSCTTDCTIKQFPVRLQLAGTVHSSQGRTNPTNAIGDFRNTQGFNYTALSRAPSFDTTYILPNTKMNTKSFKNTLSPALVAQHKKEHICSEAFINAYVTRNL